MDSAQEIQILINGNAVGYAPVTENDSWGEEQTVLLPDEYVNDSDVNTLTFNNTFNPPKTYRWGVRNVYIPNKTNIWAPAPVEAAETASLNRSIQSTSNHINYLFLLIIPTGMALICRRRMRAIR